MVEPMLPPPEPPPKAGLPAAGVRSRVNVSDVPAAIEVPIPPRLPEQLSASVMVTAGDGLVEFHAVLSGLVGGGFDGPLYVECVGSEDPVAVDRDLVWVLGDWRLARDASIVDDFGSRMEATMAGRIGNTVTINGIGKKFWKSFFGTNLELLDYVFVGDARL